MSRAIGALILLVASTAAHAQLIPFIRPGVGGASVVNPSIAFTGPTAESTHEMSVLQQVLSGSATAGSSALDRVTITCSGATTLAETQTLGTGAWLLVVTFQVGTTVCVSKVYDVADRTAQVAKTFIVISPDEEAPVVTIQKDGGNGVGQNYSINAASDVLPVVCTDDVACTALTWARTGVSGNCEGAGTSAPGGTLYNCTVSLGATNNRDTANAFTMTGVDQSQQSGTDTITITRLVTLAIISGTLPTATVDASYSRQLAETGGTGSAQVWDNGSGGTALDAFEDACTGGDISTAGVITGPFTDVGDGVCNPTVRLVDSGANTATKQLSIPVVVAGAEGPHDYFDSLVALDAAAGANSLGRSWSLRDQTQIETLNTTTEPSAQWHYEYDDGDSNATCYEGTCADTYSDPHDAVKWELPIMPCIPTTLTARTITSSSSEDPSLLVWTGTGVTQTHADEHRVMDVTISGHSYQALNGAAGLTVTIESIEGSGSDRITRGRLNVAGGPSGGTGGSVFVTTCNCERAGQTPYCGGSDDPGGTHLLRFSAGADVRTDSTATLLTTWDFYFDHASLEEAAIAGSWPRKIFGYGFPTSATGNGSLTKEVALREAVRDLTEGNGATATSIATVEVQMAGVKIAPPGVEGYDPNYVTGQGAANVGGQTPNLANFHIVGNTWTRFWVWWQFSVPMSSAVFAKWRATTGIDADGLFPLTSCVVAGATTTCTSDGEWVGNKTGSAAGPKADVGATFPVTIASSPHAPLNASFTATVVTTTTWTIPTPSGASDGTYNGGTFTPAFAALSVWVADETREATRILEAVPVHILAATPYVQFLWPFDTSAPAGKRQNILYGYGRNVVHLKNPTIDMSGTCTDTAPTLPTSGTMKGYCTVDATNNAGLFKKPVR